MRRKFTVLSLLSVLVIALGIALPAYMNRDQPVAIGGPFHTPRPTSTQFSEPLREIVQIVDAEEAETTDDITNCTYPLYYWKDYPDSWPTQIVIAGLIYTQADIFEIYHDQDPDTATLLIRQLYTAFLNILGGSNHARIDPVIVDANNWLAANPPGSAISEHNQSIARDLAASLEDYNDGLNGPPACQDVPSPPTPSPTITVTLVPGLTSTTNTPVPQTLISPPRTTVQPPSNNQPAPPGAPSQPTATQALPTAMFPSPTLPLVLPTAAPFPTQALVPPTAAPTPTLRLVIPTATNTPRPPSTNTPIPPTRANTPSPVPTNTPLPTSSFTPLPTNTEAPLPTNTEAPVPTDTEMPPPSITDTPTPDGLLPTRNPNYVSPTPTNPP